MCVCVCCTFRHVLLYTLILYFVFNDAVLLPVLGLLLLCSLADVDAASLLASTTTDPCGVFFSLVFFALLSLSIFHRSPVCFILVLILCLVTSRVQLMCCCVAWPVVYGVVCLSLTKSQAPPNVYTSAVPHCLHVFCFVSSVTTKLIIYPLVRHSIDIFSRE